MHYGSSGRNRSDGCSDPGVIEPDIGLVCDISTLSDNQKIELTPVEPFHPGGWRRVCSRDRAEGGAQMEVVFSTGVAN